MSLGVLGEGVKQVSSARDERREPDYDRALVLLNPPPGNAA